MKFRNKIILAISLSSVIFNLVFSLFVIRNQAAREYKRLDDKIKHYNNLTRVINIEPIYNFNFKTLKSNIQMVFSDEEVYAITLKDSSGEMNISLKKKPLLNNNKIRKEHVEIFKDNYKIGDAEILYSTLISEEHITDIIMEKVFLTMGLIILNIVVILIISRYLLKPIEQVIEGLRRVNNGDYGYSLKITSHDEFKQIELFFNKMLSTIKTEIKSRKENEEKLMETRNYLRNVFNSLPSMLISVTLDGIITQWNDAAEKKTGVSSIYAISKKVWDIIPYMQEYKKSLAVLINENRIEVVKKKITDSDETLYINITLSPLVYDGTCGVVIRIDDITELEIKDLQLKQAQKMETIGTLAGGIAHDFNNALGGIIGILSLLKLRTCRAEEISKVDMDEYIALMEESGNRAKDMVKQLMTLSQKNEIIFSPIDLNLTIQKVYKICQGTFDKCVEVIPNYLEGDAITKADSTQIEQTLLNLCINAYHAMTIMKNESEQSGGKLFIILEKIYVDKLFCESHPEATEQNYWKISVQDNGVGMDSRTIAKIFDPFYTTKEKEKGTGLGLAMVYSIINQHGGFIDVYSEVGIGSTFSIFLPVLESTAVDVKINLDNEKVLTGTGLILVVDDEKIMRQTATVILKECGYDIIIAENGLEAVEVYKDRYNELSCVIIDMIMPKMSAKEACIKMLNISSSVPIILSSGFREDERIEEIMRLGVSGFIQKPYTARSLAAIVNKTINK